MSLTEREAKTIIQVPVAALVMATVVSHNQPYTELKALEKEWREWDCLSGTFLCAQLSQSSPTATVMKYP